jgi:hypothetical protein
VWKHCQAVEKVVGDYFGWLSNRGEVVHTIPFSEERHVVKQALKTTLG